MGKKSRGKFGVVYSTDPDFEYHHKSEEEPESVSPEKQNLRVYLDKRNRKGKAVTIVDNFMGPEDELKDLGKLLKSKCGVGGSVKEGQVLIQGDFRDKVKEILSSQGYKVRG